MYRAKNIRKYSHVSDLNLTLSARAFADIGFAITTDLFDVHLEADAYIDMPYLNLDHAPVQNVTANCQPASANGGGPVFDALELSLQFGVAAGVDFDHSSLVNGLNKSVTTPTACLAFDEAQGSIVPATQVAARVSASKAAASSSSAAMPLAGKVGFWRLEAMQTVLVTVAATVGAGAFIL